MSTQVDLTCIEDIKAFGAFDVKACFNCGNCTAVCGLTDNDASFPRKFIRYIQLKSKIFGHIH